MSIMSESKENPASIDNIPNEILYQIVSLIPLKEAARTMILSSSWKHLWTPVKVSLNISFDQLKSQQCGQQMNQRIASFLNTYKNSYQILNLSFLEPNSLTEETLFLKATKGVDNELCISFHGQNPETFGLPIDLTLHGSNHFNSLKTLHLRSITEVAGSFLTELFSGCQNLKTLSLEKCNGLQDVNLKAHDLLQNFLILDCENMGSVTISSALNLKSFFYRGNLAKIKLKEVPKLCDVTLNFKGVNTALCDYNEFDCENIVHLLASLKDIKVLTLFGGLLEWLCTKGVTFDELAFKFDKLKELSWIDCCMNTQKRDSLASFLSITPSLENLFIKIDEKWSTVPSPQSHQSWPAQLWTETSIVKPNDFQLKHLRMVKFFGFKIEESDQMLVSLIDFLLKKSIAIKKMSVTEAENKLSWRVAKLPQSHLKRIASSSSSSSCSSNSCLLFSLNKECCFCLTPDDGN